MKKAILPKPNISKEERLAIRTLKQNKSITILLAGKGRAKDHEQYVTKAESLL